MKIVGHEALMRPLGRTPLELIEEHRIKGGLHTLELATFFGACKAYYDRDMQGILSINSFPAECFDREAFVLAEGIECKEELDFIRTTDVDYLQGYYLGMPE